MTAQRKIGAAITLVTALGVAIGAFTSVLGIMPAVGAAVIGIVIGTGVARGAFSRTPEVTKKN